MLNHIALMGRLTKDPELRHTGSNVAVASFAVAVDRDIPDKTTGQRETDFIDCVAWRGTGEFISRNFKKGAQICVDGRLQMRKWQDKDGNKRTSAEVIVDHAYFAGARGEGGSTYSAPSSGYSETEALINKYQAQNFDMIQGDDEQLPF